MQGDKRYKIFFKSADGSVATKRVEGLQIGRFGVRSVSPHATIETPFVGEREGENIWAVDHIPTGLLLITVGSFADAVIIADDLSRFALSDPSAKEPQRAAQQLGTKLRQYIREMSEEGRVFGYRAWLKGETREQEQESQW